MTKEKILNTCSSLAEKGEVFYVNKYRFTEDKKRRNCFELKKQGKLKQLPTVNKLLRFYRPEDVPKLEKSRKKHTRVMRKVYRENCRTMIDWAKKDKEKGAGLVDYYIREFWKHKHLSWHYEYQI